MNFIAFLLVAFALVVGVILIVQNWRSLLGWAVAALSAGVLVQETFTHWSHTIHN